MPTTAGLSVSEHRFCEAGAKWDAQRSPVSSTLTSVLFDHHGRGWIATADGLLVSEDGGESWKHVHIDEWLFLSRLLLLDGSLWAVGSRGVIEQVDADLAWKDIIHFAPNGVTLGDS